MHIPNYQIKEKIGEGGMAKVYLAVHNIMKRQVALKVMLPSLAKEKGFKSSFLHEGEIIAQLEHPNIVRIYDINVIDDIHYMSMEYLSEGTLKERLLKKQYSVTECITLLKQIGSGLTLAHKHGYIHRDIKPANILFSKHGTAVLTDFGIAKLQDTCSDLTKMGYMLGTAQYMSPEQATTGQLDSRSDVYSLGLVFYEMLTGKKVVSATTDLQALYQHTNEAPPTLPITYQHLQDVLNKVLAKEPDDRFNTVEAFIDGLTTANSGIKGLSPHSANKNPQKQVALKIEALPSPVAIKPWIKPTPIIAGLSAILLTGTFLYFQSDEKGIVSTAPPPSSTQNVQKINHIYEPRVYYMQLETELDLLAKETMTLLALSQKNKQTKKTLNQVLQRHHALALALLKAMNVEKARTIINKGLQLSSKNQDLVALKNAIDRKPSTTGTTKVSKIQALNNQAETHIQSKDYITPKGRNALEAYQNILVIDPYNKKAINSINKIIAIFEAKIKNNMNKNTYKANQLLNQAIAISPFNENLIQLQSKIKTMKKN